MNADDVILDECRSTWRAEARARAKAEAEALGIMSDADTEFARGFLAGREAIHYGFLSRLGMENIR